MKCPNCGNLIIAGDKFCFTCGYRVHENSDLASEKKPKCLECGAEVENGSRFCFSCGADLSVQSFPKEQIIDNPVSIEPIMIEETVPKEETSIKCPACGADNEKGSKFCFMCGSAIEGVLETSSEVITEIPEPIAEETPKAVVENNIETTEQVLDETTSVVREFESEIIQGELKDIQTEETKIGSVANDDEVKVELTSLNRCPVCNEVVEEGSKYCFKCGAATVREAATTVNEKVFETSEPISVKKEDTIKTDSIEDIKNSTPVPEANVPSEVSVNNDLKKDTANPQHRCPVCNEIVVEGSKFCLHCGADLNKSIKKTNDALKEMPFIIPSNIVDESSTQRIKPQMKCSYCGEPVIDGNKFCGNCGKTLASSAPIIRPVRTDTVRVETTPQHVKSKSKVKQICPACGAKVDEGEKFCFRCGADLALQSRPAPTKKQNQKYKETNRGNDAPIYGVKKESIGLKIVKTVKKILITLLVLLLLACLGFGSYILYNKFVKNDDSSFVINEPKENSSSSENEGSEKEDTSEESNTENNSEDGKTEESETQPEAQPVASTPAFLSVQGIEYGSPNKAYVNIVGSDNKPITDLDVNNIKLFEDDAEVKITSIETMETAHMPKSVSILIDNSDSITKHEMTAEGLQNAVKTYIDTLNFDGGDRAEMIMFDENVTQLCDYTTNKNTLKNAVSSLVGGGGHCNMNNALYRAIINTAKQPGYKCIVMFTDGKDNVVNKDDVMYSMEDVANAAKEYGVSIYVIGLNKKKVNTEAKNWYLKMLETAPGVFLHYDTHADLPQGFKDVEQLLNNLYVISYESSIASDKKRGVTVTVEGKYTGTGNFVGATW